MAWQRRSSGGRVVVAAALLALLPGAACAAALRVQPAGGQRGVVGGRATAVAPGYLGIDLRDTSEDRVSVLRLKDQHGAEIVRVDHDGPAGKMGLRVHDVVTLLNGVAIDGVEQARRLLRELSPGRLVSMVINRDGKQMVVQAQMADREELERETWEHHLTPPAEAPASGLPTGETVQAAGAGNAGTGVAGGRYSRGFIGTLLMSPTYTGVVLEKLGPQLAGFFGVANGSGLLVRSVAVNSPAEVAGLRAGDVVVRANQASVSSTSEWTKAISKAKGGPVSVVVMRDRQEKTLTLTPDTKKRSGLDPERLDLERLKLEHAEPERVMAGVRLAEY